MSPFQLQMIQACLNGQLESEMPQNLTYYVIQATNLRKNKIYYHGYFLLANTIFGYLIPFVFLVILNVLIVKTLNAAPSKADIMVANSVLFQPGRFLYSYSETKFSM